MDADWNRSTRIKNRIYSRKDFLLKKLSGPCESSLPSVRIRVSFFDFFIRVKNAKELLLRTSVSCIGIVLAVLLADTLVLRGG